MITFTVFISIIIITVMVIISITTPIIIIIITIVLFIISGSNSLLPLNCYSLPPNVCLHNNIRKLFSLHNFSYFLLSLSDFQPIPNFYQNSVQGTSSVHAFLYMTSISSVVGRSCTSKNFKHKKNHINHTHCINTCLLHPFPYIRHEIIHCTKSIPSDFHFRTIKMAKQIVVLTLL